MNCTPCIADQWVSNARRENALATELDDRAMAECGSLAPVRWWLAGTYRCVEGHVTSVGGKASAWGRQCPVCGGYSLITFPEDREGSLT